jgi:hypothetical protein
MWQWNPWTGSYFFVPYTPTVQPSWQPYYSPGRWAWVP